MIFLVTYFVEDSELGSNYFWHAALGLSVQYDENEKIEMKHAWGFYSVPMSAPDTMVGRFKKKVGFNFDLQGNHGILKEEDMRFLDKGYGLRGVTFEITLEQFLNLKRRCTAIIAPQNKAIKEVGEALIEKQRQAMPGMLQTVASYALPKRIYGYFYPALTAPTSYDIYREELRLAEEQKRASRLKPFELKISMTGKGPSLKESYTCKCMALDLLRDIGIKQELLAPLTPNDRSLVLPRYGGELEPFYLHSTGKRYKFKKNEIAISYYRTWKNKDDGNQAKGQKGNDAKLFWSVVPQRFLASQHAKPLFELPRKYIVPIKRLVRQLQSIEQVVVAAKLDNQYKAFIKSGALLRTSHQELIDHIVKLYSAFATINSKTSAEMIEACINHAKELLSNLDFAINDGWDDLDCVETMAAFLPITSQKQMCKIMGCVYAPISADVRELALVVAPLPATSRHQIEKRLGYISPIISVEKEAPVEEAAEAWESCDEPNQAEPALEDSSASPAMSQQSFGFFTLSPKVGRARSKSLALPVFRK